MIKRGSLTVALFVAIPVVGVAVAQMNDSSKAFMEVHEKMKKDMATPSRDTDKDFAMMMIPHHQGDIDMAEVELKFGNPQRNGAEDNRCSEKRDRRIQKVAVWAYVIKPLPCARFASGNKTEQRKKIYEIIDVLGRAER